MILVTFLPSRYCVPILYVSSLIDMGRKNKTLSLELEDLGSAAGLCTLQSWQHSSLPLLHRCYLLLAEIVTVAFTERGMPHALGFLSCKVCGSDLGMSAFKKM